MILHQLFTEDIVYTDGVCIQKNTYWYIHWYIDAAINWNINGIPVLWQWIYLLVYQWIHPLICSYIYEYMNLQIMRYNCWLLNGYMLWHVHMFMNVPIDPTMHMCTGMYICSWMCPLIPQCICALISEWYIHSYIDECSPTHTPTKIFTLLGTAGSIWTGTQLMYALKIAHIRDCV
jgi:hypothetical protein